MEITAANELRITALDHLVLTVADTRRTIDFYVRVLGMQSITFGDGRQALMFGPSKINLHVLGHEIRPHAAHPVAGSADLCLLTESSPSQVLKHLDACGIQVEEGPVSRTGARTDPQLLRARPRRQPDRDQHLPHRSVADGLAPDPRRPVSSS